MTPQEFILKWGYGSHAATLNERQGAQSHFIDLCALLDLPPPGSDPDYTFEQDTLVLGQTRGFADVFKRGCFAWENKAPGKNLDDALRQLRNYAPALANPPLLVVCDRLIIRVHTQFTGHPSLAHTFTLPDLAQADKRALLRKAWTEPEAFRPRETSRDITEAAAKSFATLAEQLRKRGHHPDTVAHFLTQCLFSFFAEDVGLLPERMFERLVGNRYLTCTQVGAGMTQLFATMRDGGLFGVDDIPWFNGGLFKKIDVPKLEIPDVTELRNAANKTWNAIDVSIFGTLFERGLDPAKRSQLGAHYTDPATIMRLVEPVIQRPLLQQWEQEKAVIQKHLQASKKKGDKGYKQAHGAFITWLDKLRDYRVLDPACGSGNFLFLGLKVLKDIEHKSHLDAEALGLDREANLVTGPHNVLGIELNEYAAELARVTVWIGELQWRMDKGFAFKRNPVLEPLDHIECRDALLSFVPADDARPAGQEAIEAGWPKASVVIGNPPFLGGSKKRRELGDAYFEALDKVYAGRVPGGADLVCYWFDKSRKQIKSHGLGAAGLVATQSIRAGSNRVVLERIVNESRIFDAWADEPWVNEGAAVRVSLVSFGWGECCTLNGTSVRRISPDLGGSSEFDLTTSVVQKANRNRAYKGAEKSGSFDISGELARDWLTQPNPHGKPNSDVLRPWRNGADIAGRCVDHWIIDFGVTLAEVDASLYESPFAHVLRHVKPDRDNNPDRGRRGNWWRFGRNGADLRNGSKNLRRFIVTPRVAKHRYFVWFDAAFSPDSRLFAIACADDTTFGVLSSRIHEVWSLAQASMHGVGNDPTYNAKSCFETFPFPPGLTPADTAHQQTEALASGAWIPAQLANAQLPQLRQHASAIAEAAHRLNALREAWLNPPEWTQRVSEVVPLGMDHSPYPDRIEPRPGLSEADRKALQQRTLTKLYNQRPAWLDAAHRALDVAVAAAYGWNESVATLADEDILQRLLALNLQRASDDKPLATKRQ